MVVNLQHREMGNTHFEQRGGRSIRPHGGGGLPSTSSSGAECWHWPVRRKLFGVPVSCTSYDEVVTSVIGAARHRIPGLVTAFAVHGVVTAAEDAAFRRRIEDFHIVTPDGQPVRHALNLLYRAGLRDRVYGPELTVRLCQRAAECGVPVYLYGSTQQTVERLRRRLIEHFPALQVVGAEPSVFRPLSADEDHLLIERINRSGARIVFVGLGCPRQEVFAHEHYPALQTVQVCVGAAFDFIAGTKRMAPRWMQDHALEWIYRLSQEPRRLFGRYTTINAKFLGNLLVQLVASAWGSDAATSTSSRCKGPE
jgi:N-acetylglucosaminyldiphosphoundecaprenol N-acetyl-beta-D-mannosaminyltransferase